jgi:hypothetical protein
MGRASPTRIAAALASRWPELDAERPRIASNAPVLFILSHIVLPLQPIEQTAEVAAPLSPGSVTAGSVPPRQVSG